MSREVEQGWASWTSFASSCPSCSSTAVQRTLSLWLCPSTAVETAIAQCTSRWAMAWGHRLNTSIVLAAVRGLSGLFRTVSAVEPSLCRPLPTLSPSLISHLASVDVKQQWRSCKNYRGKGMEGVKKSVFVSFFWLTRRSRVVEKMRSGASYSTSNKLLLVARHILTTGL